MNITNIILFLEIYYSSSISNYEFFHINFAIEKKDKVESVVKTIKCANDE
jgi:hypothetical protein